MLMTGLCRRAEESLVPRRNFRVETEQRTQLGIAGYIGSFPRPHVV